MKFVKLFLISIALSSCSTMFNSGSQTVSVVGSSGEENVEIQVTTPDGVYKSKIPATIVSSPSTFTPTEIRVTDKCYDELTMQVKKSITPSFYANVFNWCFGCVVDPLTGAMWKLNNHTVIPLTKKDHCRK